MLTLVLLFTFTICKTKQKFFAKKITQKLRKTLRKARKNKIVQSKLNDG